jgi:ABC-type enterochelin transport system substrate-binding protein
MKSLNYLLLILTSLLLLACGPDNSPKTKLIEEQRNALDKAKEVDITVQKQMQETQQNVEKQTQ